jgi:uncharacterized protein YukE
MAFLGMNVEEVQALSTQMSSAAQEITSILNQVTSALSNAQWVGPDHDRFVSDWSTLHSQALTTVANGLTEASQKASQNAQQQTEASNT